MQTNKQAKKKKKKEKKNQQQRIRTKNNINKKYIRDIQENRNKIKAFSVHPCIPIRLWRESNNYVNNGAEFENGLLHGQLKTLELGNDKCPNLL